MRKILFLSAFWVVIGLSGPTSQEAVAQCTHFGNQGACPVGIPNGSTSVTVNANGTITWNSGGISGPCCAAPSGTETGAGLLNLNNELGRPPFRFGPVVSGLGRTSDSAADTVVLTGTGFEDRFLGPDIHCDFSGCSGNDLLGDVFGANPNSGYLCDGGGAGCGNDLWTSAPQPGFGSCGPGGCGEPAPITALDFSNIPGTGPYAANQTSGNIDPFGGGGSFFMDPATGQAISISDNPTEWPTHVQHADGLNTAYINGEIPYPFNDPDWSNKSVDDFKNNQAENQGGTQQANESNRPDFYVTTESAEAAAGGRQNFSGKTGRFGIGTDTSLGNVGGLSARFQVAKNFGIQAIVSFVRVDPNTDNPNTDLTNYVSAAIVSTQPGTRPANFVSVLPIVTPGPASKPAEENTEAAPEPRTNTTHLTIASPDGPGVARVDREGEDSTFHVLTIGGRSVEFKNRSDAFFFSNRLKNESDGKTFDQMLNELPEGREPINQGPATTNPVDAIAESVPREFRAPKVNDIRIGEFLITDPRTNRQIEVKSAEQRDAVLNAMRNGATLEQAAEAAKNAPTVTPDGLASATSSSTPRSTPSTPAPAGSVPTFANNRPAIILPSNVTTTPDGLASANSGGASTPSTPAPAGSAPTFTNNRPAIIVAPTRPAGESAGFMTAGLQGTAYRIEIIKTPDGKTLAVGTGENAGHVFGEVKETSNKLFGDWRREGPWSPPPAKTAQSAATSVATPALRAAAPPQSANAQVRSQIANSDRDHMIQPVFLDGFESGNTSAWSSTGR